MESMLSQLLDTEQEKLVSALLSGLMASGASHYREVGDHALRARCERLINELGKAIRCRSGSFSDYIEGVARERIPEGYALEELQTALKILEREVWVRCARTLVDASELVEGLSLVATTISAAKDRLARIYLDHEKESHRTAADLRIRGSELFRGTDIRLLGPD
jgi:hypothetical protein